LILNWDIIDGRYLRIFQKRPQEQRKVIEYILNLWAENKVKITYLKGNHERFWKNLLPIKINNIIFADEITYLSWNKKYLICHGQQFDQQYCCGNIINIISFLWWTFLFRLNRKFNKTRKQKGKKYFSLVSQIKKIAKIIALWWMKSFEKKIIKTLDEKKCDGLICGHLHKPEIKKIGKYSYFNSGDRIESCTVLIETENNEWELIKYQK
jgi:UDP-2,3-diacylglucosamine pyrophosphatase LpxH